MNKKSVTALLTTVPLISAFLLVACDSSDKGGGYRPPSGHSEPANKKDWENRAGLSEPAPSQ